MKKLLKYKKLIKKILSDLSPEDRFILLSREIENLSFKEIALITGKTADDLQKHLRQLKDKLQEQVIKPGKKTAP